MSSYAIEIRRAGQHPYLPGKIRFSTGFIIVVWMMFCIGFSTQLIEMSGARVMWTVVVMFSGCGALYGLGIFMASRNPYYQEMILASIMRTLRGRRDLET